MKKEKLQSIWKMSKEKLIFLFCSGLLLFVISIPNGDGGTNNGTGNAGKAAGSVSSPAAAGDTAGYGAGSSAGYSTGNSLGSGREENGDDAENAANVSTVQDIKSPSFGSGQAAETYEAELERRIREILTNVDGVGEVDVMVVLKSSEEKVIHVDKNTSVSSTEEKSESGTSRVIKGQELSESTVMGSQSQEPIIEKELSPEVSGIVISADGGGSAAVKAEISEAMEALFGLPAHKIKVLKRVKKGV